MREALVAVFDTPTHADQAVRALQAAGIPSAAIRRYRQGDAAIPRAGKVGAAPATDEAPSERMGGFWAWLLGEEGTTSTGWRDPAYVRDEHLYTKSVEGGNSVIAVYVDQSDADRVMKLIAEQNPMKLEDTGTATMTTGTAATPTATGASEAKEQTIPLSEEHVEVGKRRVEEPVSVRRYVVERPVEQQVNLRDERVEIERRKASGGTPGRAFEERTVEVHEAHEKPDVRKTAQVAEEVVVRKETTEHPETVRDTVRREDVEVNRQQNRKRA
jgi:stress response protein YsnF